MPFEQFGLLRLDTRMQQGFGPSADKQSKNNKQKQQMTVYILSVDAPCVCLCVCVCVCVCACVCVCVCVFSRWEGNKVFASTALVV